jgi:hypothetical protein
MLPDNIELEIERPVLTDYQKKILYSEARFTVTKGATKIGKTFPHLFWLFEKAHEQKKAGANYWWVAPIYAQAKIAFNRMRRVAVELGYRINESELFIETDYDSRIWFKSADKPDSLYGEDVFAVVFDEFTRAKEGAWSAIRSTLTHTRGQCKFIGNSKGKKNWGHKLWLKAKAGEPGYEAFKVTAYDAVDAGILELAEVEQAKRDLPELAFRELYLAEDLDDQANPFGIQAIQNCVKPISNLEPVCYGVDLAKSVDWTVIVGLDQNGEVCYFDRFQSDWTQTTRKVIQTIGYKPANIDSTGVGDPIFELVSKECSGAISFKFTQHSKQQLMERLAVSIQKGEISVLSGTMQDELENFEYEYTKTGVRYSAPDGSHDDCVMSLALATEIHTKSPAGVTGFSIAPSPPKQKQKIYFS